MPLDIAQIRLDNALVLFDEFVRTTAQHADAATLRGLERRFAERLQIQPSYWSQIKSRSRQIGDRLARQFELLCKKPHGWMDTPQGASPQAAVAVSAPSTDDDRLPRDEDERFIVGLVLTYYRRHPQRARARLLDLLGEVLMTPQAMTPAPAAPQPQAPAAPAMVAPGVMRPAPKPAPAPESDMSLWMKQAQGIAPLKKKR